MSIIHSFFLILAIIATGFIIGKNKVLSQSQAEGLEVFLFKVAMPCYLFTSTLHYNLAILLNVDYIISYLMFFLVIASLMTFFFCRKDTRAALCIKILASGYVNAAIYTLPIITFLLNDATAGILGNILQIIVIQSIFIIFLSFTNHKEESLARKLLTIFTTPLIMMPIIGLLCNYLQFKPYAVITTMMQSLGSGASSIALFTFGLTLSDIKIKKKDFDKSLLLIVFIKNIAHPLIAFFIGNYIFNLDTYWLCSLVIAASAPTAFVVYLIAKQFSTEVDLVKRVVAVSSIISLISLGVIISTFGLFTQ